MKKKELVLSALCLVLSACAVMTAQAAEAVKPVLFAKDVRVEQRFPWTNLVDVCFMVTNTLVKNDTVIARVRGFYDGQMMLDMDHLYFTKEDGSPLTDRQLVGGDVLFSVDANGDFQQEGLRKNEVRLVWDAKKDVPTEEDGTQDLSLMKELIRNLPDKPVFVRTTILPGSSEMLSRETGHRVYFMPEFLTERTYIEDFRTQPMVFTGEIDLLSRIFVGKQFTRMTSLEAEITKYAHNVFGAYKVTYFNAVYDYCRRMGADYKAVHTGMLLSGYINDMHTAVPGPDGKFGYGGKCFPKDVNALAKQTEGTPLGRLIAPLHELNVQFRGAEERI